MQQKLLNYIHVVVLHYTIQDAINSKYNRLHVFVFVSSRLYDNFYDFRMCQLDGEADERHLMNQKILYNHGL